MRNSWRICGLVLVVLVMGGGLLTHFAYAQSSANFRMEKSVIDGGSGRMGGANFGLAGTIGQKDTGYMSSDSFVLQAGFWPQPAVTPQPDPTDTPAPDPTDTPAPDPTDTPEPDPTETPDPTEPALFIPSAPRGE